MEQTDKSLANNNPPASSSEVARSASQGSHGATLALLKKQTIQVRTPYIWLSGVVVLKGK